MQPWEMRLRRRSLDLPWRRSCGAIAGSTRRCDTFVKPVMLSASAIMQGYATGWDMQVLSPAGEGFAP